MFGKCALLVAFFAVVGAQPGGPLVAVAYMQAVSTNTFTWSGYVTFEQMNGTGVVVTCNVMTSAPDGEYGMHVHTWGDITNSAGSYVGGHYNPNTTSHGCPGSATHHVGDLGNVTVTGNMITTQFIIPYLTLNGAQSIVGRALIIHNSTDDCTPTWTGVKAAMGVIGIKNVMGNQAIVSDVRVWTAAVQILPTGAFPNTVSGSVVIYETQANTTRLFMTLTGLMPNKQYSWHIHTWGDMNNTAGFGMGAGVHYDPMASNLHGWPGMLSTARHGGDLGNFTTDVNGAATANIDVDVLRLNGPNSIVGRMVIIHNQTDIGPGAALTNGNAGARIGFGVIGMSNYTINPNAYPAEVGVAWVASTAEEAMNGNFYNGSVSFTRVGANVAISGMVTGFAPNSGHAVHIHQWGDVSSNTSTGGHYNPLNVPHGCPSVNATFHMGDLGNFMADGNGVIAINVNVPYLDLGGVSSVIGRALVIHSAMDDCATQPTGNSGMRLAAGVIGIANISPNWAFANPSLGTFPAFANPNGLALGAFLLNTSNSQSPINGQVWLYYDSATYSAGFGIMVAANVNNVPPSTNITAHGWHLHTWGDITDRSGSSAGPHYNPYGVGHDLPATLPRHQGDLGNVGQTGSTISTLLGPYNVGSLTWDKNVIGRAFMLHAADDYGSAGGATGGAGARIAVGVIGIYNGATVPMPPPPPPPAAPPATTAATTDGTTTSAAGILSAPLALIVMLAAALLL